MIKINVCIVYAASLYMVVLYLPLDGVVKKYTLERSAYPYTSPFLKLSSFTHDLRNTNTNTRIEGCVTRGIFVTGTSERLHVVLLNNFSKKQTVICTSQNLMSSR